MAVLGDGPHVVGEYAGECGIRSLFNAAGFRLYGDGGTKLPPDFCSSLFVLEDVDEVDVVDAMDSLVAVDSSDIDLWNALAGGLARIGVKALRKSV